MKALSTRNDEPERASRPYDKGRDGFVLGEGAGMLVLESAEHAEARGARVYAEIAGAGHHRRRAPHRPARPVRRRRGQGDAHGARRRRPRGLRRRAHQRARDVDAGRRRRRGGAIRSALGDAADGVAVTATKSMTGHLLGAAGAVETIAVILALHYRTAPPTINLDDLDDEMGLDVVRGEPRPLGDGVLAALNNSFGFGGHNVALAFRSV